MTRNYLQCHKEESTHITSTTINKMINPNTEAQLCFIHSCTTFYDNILDECSSLLWNFRLNKIYHFALILELGRSKDCFTLISAKDLDVMIQLKLLLSTESNCQSKHVEKLVWKCAMPNNAWGWSILQISWRRKTIAIKAFIVLFKTYYHISWLHLQINLIESTIQIGYHGN